MKMLVIGAGFLGTEIIKLADLSIDVVRVIGARRRVGSSDGLASPMISLDVLKPESFSSIPDDISHIVYSVSAGESSEQSYHNAYVQGVYNLAHFISRSALHESLRSFVFISSTGVYSEDTGGMVTEESPTGGTSFRSNVIKEAEEQIPELFPSTRNLVLRLSGIYGPGRNYMFNYARDLDSTCLSDSDTWTNRIHVHDAARACLFLLSKHQGIYNISDNVPAPRSDVISYIRQISKYPPLMFKSPKCVSGKQVSNQKLLETGFTFAYPSYREGYLEYI